VTKAIKDEESAVARECVCTGHLRGNHPVQQGQT
jgi:hypothetical protein